jgi:hypothetical protein
MLDGRNPVYFMLPRDGRLNNCVWGNAPTLKRE